ncbi:hypothetical protein HPP92_027376 [Vanilla planifolia]|uniref:NAC domain-containing protein n=1 Tax=Vanilla planifolia TaxID=51239 RepID=A0A835U4H5_VANPL|nr:hypothetical protein HPP92_027376 [Vanilla planifolia]
MEREGGCSLSAADLPPGFRFHPTDQELIVHYLRKRVTSSLPPDSSIIADVDLYKYNPWELPEKAFFGEGQWFFFSHRERKYPNGVRPNRVAASGYWKATGADKPILAAGSAVCLGVKKALVFYRGQPPKGTKTDWIMHEYRLFDFMARCQSLKPNGSTRLDELVLCRVQQRAYLPKEKVEMPELLSPESSAVCKSHPSSKKQYFHLLQTTRERINVSELSYRGNSEETKRIEECSDLTNNGGRADECIGAQQLHDDGLDWPGSMLCCGKRKLSFDAGVDSTQLQNIKHFGFSEEL